MSTTAAATATYTAVPSLTAPLKALPPAKEIPLTFAAGAKSEAGTNASAYAEERLLRYISINGPPLRIATILNRWVNLIQTNGMVSRGAGSGVADPTQEGIRLVSFPGRQCVG